MNREIKRAHTHIMSIITQLVIDTKFQYILFVLTLLTVRSTMLTIKLTSRFYKVLFMNRKIHCNVFFIRRAFISTI